MKFIAKDVRDEWKEYLYAWAGANGPLCSKGKPEWFRGKALPLM